jgi:putative hydrolase of the HAD superfamily
VPSILLLDLDHTLYPSTAPTLAAVDARITRFIETRLDLPADKADQMRRDLCAEHGTTLRGLEMLHGVGRGEYTDFIQDLEDHLMPAPDPRLRAWLMAAARRLPTYLFTNARRDWADRCLGHLGLTDLLEESPEAPALLGGILDIDFMEWAGKPHREAFEKVERYLADRHPVAAGFVFADDRLDNLAAARARGWRTVWVRPHDAPPGLGADHRIVDALIELDPDTLE